MTKHWNANQDHELAELWLRGFSASEIADQLAPDHDNKLSRNAVCGRLFRLGLTHKPGVAQARAARPAPGYRPKPRLAKLAPAPAPAAGAFGQVGAAAFNQVGVRYLDNAGCTAIIHNQGEDGLPVCCGRPLYYDAQRRRLTSFCERHDNIFRARTKSDLEYIYGKASSFG